MDKYADVHHIGEALFRRRRELGLRQDEAARLLGVEGRTLSRYEHGEVEPKGVVIVARMARLFGDDVDPAELARLFLVTKIHIGRQRAEDDLSRDDARILEELLQARRPGPDGGGDLDDSLGGV
jgi:transcriptional regulator with XRE-family HTH domain